MSCSSFESLCSTILYEIFDYLSTYNIFHAFINLNHRLKRSIHSYRLHIDFRKMSRLKFDLICSCLRPEQVISLIFSDEDMAGQVAVFQRHFPYFKYQFTHLRSIKFLKTENILCHLPDSVTCLTFHECFYVDSKLIINVIVGQAKSLTHLEIDSWDISQLTKTKFPSLTRLAIDNAYINDTSDLLQRSKAKFVDVHLWIQNLHSPITHLKLLIGNRTLTNYNAIFNFDYLSHSLTNFTLICLANETNFSSELIQHYLIRLSNLKSLTTIIRLGFIDGKQWEEFLRKSQIIKFNFHFILSENVIFNHDGSKLLDSFRSPFWLEEKRWYVAYSKRCTNTYTHISITSVSKFLSKITDYTLEDYPPLSTVPPDLTQRIFYSRCIDMLILHLDESKIQTNYLFTRVNLLHLNGSKLPSIHDLVSIVDLNQIKELDISRVKNISIGGIHLIIEHMPRLNHLIFKHFIPLFQPPAHIYTLSIETWQLKDDFDLFCRMFSNVKSLKIDITSLEMMIELVKRLKYLEDIGFWYPFEKYAHFISMKWLRRNMRRLQQTNFTCRTDEYYPLLSIGNQRIKHHQHSIF
ncbi:unnamed protein product [Rotaria socialis]